MHQQHEVDTVLRLVAEGLNDCQISRATAINRTSIREFTNNSEDLLRIFREACDAADIECRMSKPNTISTARHAAVAKLDAFIGPKA